MTYTTPGYTPPVPSAPYYDTREQPGMYYPAYTAPVPPIYPPSTIIYTQSPSHGHHDHNHHHYDHAHHHHKDHHHHDDDCLCCCTII